MSIEAMKQALDLLETCWGCGDQDTLDHWNETAQVLRQAIEQAESFDKLVAENQRLRLYDDGQPTCQENRQVAKNATTEWVGLDHEQMRNTPIEFNRGALWAERYLKEKNS